MAGTDAQAGGCQGVGSDPTPGTGWRAGAHVTRIRRGCGGASRRLRAGVGLRRLTVERHLDPGSRGISGATAAAGTVARAGYLSADGRSGEWPCRAGAYPGSVWAEAV